MAFFKHRSTIYQPTGRAAAPMAQGCSSPAAERSIARPRRAASDLVHMHMMTMSSGPELVQCPRNMVNVHAHMCAICACTCGTVFSKSQFLPDLLARGARLLLESSPPFISGGPSKKSFFFYVGDPRENRSPWVGDPRRSFFPQK